MALRSWLAHFKDKVDYFVDWRFNYQKTRVIDSLRFIDEALERYSNAAFFVRYNRGELFYIPKGRGDKGETAYALFYEDALFLNYIVKNWKFDTSRLSKYEKADYELAVKKLQDWEKLDSFMTEVRGFVADIRYTIAFRRFAHSMAWNYVLGYPDLEREILTKYNKLMDELKDYPEWQAKVKKEVEPWIKLLSDQVANLPGTDNPFNDLNLHKYFK